MSYYTTGQLDLMTSTLALLFPELCTRVQLPNVSVLGRPIYATRLAAGGGSNRRGILVVGGTHSQELMNPDAIVELLYAMVLSYDRGTDIVLGNRRWDSTEVKLMIDALDIWMVPCANPDGRDFVMSDDDLWRKNRRDNPRTNCDGVDLNRNYDILWGVTEGNTSCDPCARTFVGSAPLSEPETQNIEFLLNTQRIDTFVDVHSYLELVLYPWSHAYTQTTDPTQRFTGLPTGTCAPIGRPGYREYMPPRDQLRFQTVADRIVAAIADVRGRQYTPQTGRDLYATTGTSKDYAYSRHIANPGTHKTYSFTFETGPWAGNEPDSFHPADPALIKRDTKSGILALIQQTICAIEFIGVTFLGRTAEVEALSAVRDDTLATTEAGRGWISLLERVQASLLATVLADETLARQATTLLERAGVLLEDGDAVAEEDDVKRGIGFLEGVMARRPDLLGDLKNIRAELEKVAGSPARAIIARLMVQGPQGMAGRGSRN